MKISPLDLRNLQEGKPPENEDFLAAMTLGQELWLNRFQEHYLERYIVQGGSKVKVLLGAEGTGKTHLIRFLLQKATDLGYEVVYLSARDYRLNNLLEFYQQIAKTVVQEKLIKNICLYVAQQMGHGEGYDGSEPLAPRLYQKYGREAAVQEIKETAYKLFKDIDFGPSFKSWCQGIVKNRAIEGNEVRIEIALKWLQGIPLDRREKQDLLLFERLQKNNARYWLNSLIHLLKLSGSKGLIVAIDDLDVMLERSEETNKHYYSPNAIKDTCEVFRQIIDDTELLNHFLLLLAGRKEVMEDDKRGFKSYEALYMRLQTGLVDTGKFNPYSDIINTDKHLQLQGDDFPLLVYEKLREILTQSQVKLVYKGLPDLAGLNELRAQVIEAAMTPL